MDSRTFKDTIYTEFARIGKVLSSPKRIELLDLLSQSPKSVEKLARESKMSVANTSKHLQVLLDARLVFYRKEKNHVIYRLANAEVVNLLYATKAIAEQQITEVNELRNAFIVRPDEMETLTLEEWLKRKDDNYLTIDVRPREEYENAHLDGAISIPIDELHGQLNELPKNIDVVAYCRGPYCVYATEAVEQLKSRGFKAYRLEAGVHEWKQLQNNLR